MKVVLTLIVIFIFQQAFAQNAVQKTTGQLNQGSYDATNAANSVVGAVNSTKAIGDAVKSLNLFKKKNKKEDVADAGGQQSVTQTASVTSTVTIITFDKIDFMKMKRIKDTLVANKKIVSVKTNFGNADGNFIKVEHTTDSDDLTAIIMEKWPNDFKLISTAEDKISFNAK